MRGIHPDNAAQAEFWNGAVGQRWTDRQEAQDVLLRPVDERLFASASVQRGERAIDIGCGCGATTIALAREVAPGGEVLGLDISEQMLGRARERAGAEPSVTFALADATIYKFASRAADIAISRFGVMFFADPVIAFVNLRTGLRTGGRLVLACWRAAKLNPWMTLPLREASKHAPPLPETGPEDPGPFSFASDERIRNILAASGYGDIALAPHDFELDLAGGRGLDAAVETAMSIGPASRSLRDQSEDVRAAAAADIRSAFAPHARGASVPLGAAMWIVTAVNPGG
jgi:SAM-dependent methyltransferase